MEDKQILIENIDKVHTTKMGIDRIKKNLKIENDVVDYCKNKILDKKCSINRQGKNFYCSIEDIIITVNVRTYTIITAHRTK